MASVFDASTSAPPRAAGRQPAGRTQDSQAQPGSSEKSTGFTAVFEDLVQDDDSDGSSASTGAPFRGKSKAGSGKGGAGSEKSDKDQKGEAAPGSGTHALWLAQVPLTSTRQSTEDAFPAVPSLAVHSGTVPDAEGGKRDGETGAREVPSPKLELPREDAVSQAASAAVEDDAQDEPEKKVAEVLPRSTSQNASAAIVSARITREARSADTEPPRDSPAPADTAPSFDSAASSGPLLQAPHAPPSPGASARKEAAERTAKEPVPEVPGATPQAAQTQASAPSLAPEQAQPKDASASQADSASSGAGQGDLAAASKGKPSSHKTAGDATSILPAPVMSAVQPVALPRTETPEERAPKPEHAATAAAEPFTSAGNNRLAAAASAQPELAFRARLVPLDPGGQPEQVKTFQPPPASKTPAPAAAAERPSAAVPPPDASPAPEAQPGKSAEPQPKSESHAADPGAGQPQARTEVSTQPGTSQPVPAAAGANAAPDPRATPARADPAAPAAPPQPPQAAEARTAAVKDIRFEVHGPDQRVEVRLSERAGEVRVAVRTPDAGLAADLRENLPALSSRLEQAGFRTEALPHEAGTTAADAGRDMHHSAESGNGDSGQGSRDSSGGQKDQQQQRPRLPDEISGLKSKRKDFAWFLSTQA